MFQENMKKLKQNANKLKMIIDNNQIFIKVNEKILIMEHIIILNVKKIKTHV